MSAIPSRIPADALAALTPAPVAVPESRYPLAETLAVYLDLTEKDGRPALQALLTLLDRDELDATTQEALKVLAPLMRLVEDLTAEQARRSSQHAG